MIAFQTIGFSAYYLPQYSQKVNLPGLEISQNAGAVIEHGTVILEAENIGGN